MSISKLAIEVKVKKVNTLLPLSNLLSIPNINFIRNSIQHFIHRQCKFKRELIRNIGIKDYKKVN